MLARNRNPVRTARLTIVFQNARRIARCTIAIESRDAAERYLFNVTANRAFGKEHRHPRLEPCQERRRNLWVGFKIIIEPVGIGVTQILEPLRRALIGRLGFIHRHV